MTNESGLSPVPNIPDDESMVNYLNKLFAEANEEYWVIYHEFQEVVEMTKENGEPIEFAYARLLNHLADMDAPVILRALSSVIWRFSKSV